MNGPTKMYSLKPLVHFSSCVDSTPTMYGMKSIYRSSNFSSSEATGRVESLPNISEQVNMLLKVYYLL